MKSFLFYCLLCVSSFVALPVQLQALTYDIGDIRVVGLQRVSAASVFSSVSIKANSQISDEQIKEAIRDLFATGFFNDVKIGRDGNALIITVEERPVVNSIIIEGNKIIEKEPLLDGLKAIGLAEGEIFKQSALQEISKQLSSQYSALGRYSAQIETLVRNIGQNQVIVGIRINEGLVAKIKYINIVGNTRYDDEELREEFSLNTTGIWSWISGNDKYAREKLAGDLENLKSFYLDRGYLKFSVTSTQVSLSPDKETVFITVNIEEGERYKVSEVSLSGDPVLPENEIKPLIIINEGDVFSQLLVTRSETAIKKRLGNDGYSAAAVSGIPDINEDDKTVKLNFFVRPGSISYVRRISFSGNSATSDYVLRREMRQLEGAPVSAEKLELSRVRLQRLGLFGEVRLTTKEVPGTTDQVDIEISVTEQPTASVNFSLGYSEGGGVTIGAGLQDNNWLGSGNTFGFNVERSDTETTYNLNYTNPFYTPDGVSRGIRLFYRERDFDEISVSNYATDTFGLKVTLGYPVSETGRLSFGFGFENIRIEPGATTAQEIVGTPNLRSGVNNAYVSNDFYNNEILDVLGSVDNGDTNNNGFLDEKDNIPSNVSDSELENIAIDTDSNGVDGDGVPASVAGYEPFTSSSSVLRESGNQGFLDQYGDTFDNLTFDVGWSDSTFDRGIFPTEGISQRLNLEVAIPGGDLEYYKLVYRNDIYFPIVGKSALHFRSRFGYGDSYGDIEGLPFFENFFSGGVGSVRGFENSSLGPKGTPANAYVAVPVYLDTTGTPDRNNPDYVYVLAGDGQLLTATDGDRDSFGGNILVELSAELVLPIPFIKSTDKARVALFVDSGNVFSTNCNSGQENCDNVDLNKLSVAGGISLQWLSPVGPMSFNFSRPIKEQPFDETESFQFSLGRSF